MKNKEIEELLNYLKDENEYCTEEEVLVNCGELILEKEDVKLLLSYIEELEEEIERQSKLQVIQDDEITEANDSITWWQNRYNAIVKQNDDNHKKVVKLENNRDKVIRTLESLKGSARWERHLYEIDYMLDMLRGGSDE